MKEKGLQKFTETEIKCNKFLSRKVLTKKALDRTFTHKEKQVLGSIIQKQLNILRSGERDAYLLKIDSILPDDAKNQMWENNHYKITVAMTKAIEEEGKMPTKNNLATETGLSRQTIHNHLKNYNEHPLYAAQMQQFKFMSDRILAKVMKLASQGDIKASRLYFEVIGSLNNQVPNNQAIKNQNNYIQINGTVLSQDAIQNLTPAQTKQIEAILNQSAPVVQLSQKALIR